MRFNPFFNIGLLIAATALTACQGPGGDDSVNPYVEPTYGPLYGGTRVSVHGSDFTDGMRVRIGEAECVDVEFISANELNCTTTASDAGLKEVKVDKESSFEPHLVIEDGFEYRCDDNDLDGAIVWANDGGNKIPREDTRATCDPLHVTNSVWDSEKVSVFGAKNEVVHFNLLIEAAGRDIENVTVDISDLTGPAGVQIRGEYGTGDSIFDWRNRQIELFYVRYLKIEGLSSVSYDRYDERHIPQRFRRDFLLDGKGDITNQDELDALTPEQIARVNQKWTDRPDHDKHYPDIAVPLELENGFGVKAGESQSIWVDIYIPKSAAAGIHSGTITVSENGGAVQSIPVELNVRDFTLPDEPSAKTMVPLGYGAINTRYIGESDPEASNPESGRVKTLRDRHFLLAHRHKISLVDDNNGVTTWNTNEPRPEWIPRLNGTLFTAENGYDGPGVETGNGIFAIGPYGKWSWKPQAAGDEEAGDDEADEASMHLNTDAWEQWFADHAPDTERFLFLNEGNESVDTLDTWTSWMKSNPGIGANLKAFALIDLPTAVSGVSGLDIVASFFNVGLTDVWQGAYDALTAEPEKSFYLYNAKRPNVGSLAIEDDGTAPRTIGWAMHKKNIDRFFYWDSAYYYDFQSGRGHNDLFGKAHTLGLDEGVSDSVGRYGWKYSNGEGVLFYPGTDTVHPADSYGLEGPIASLRLKLLRRGIQDADYLALAKAKDAEKTAEIVQRMLPKTLWEYGASNPADPTYLRTDISWKSDAEAWEAARKELADLIEGN